jgi:hypothetical protein
LVSQCRHLFCSQSRGMPMHRTQSCLSLQQPTGSLALTLQETTCNQPQTRAWAAGGGNTLARPC